MKATGIKTDRSWWIVHSLLVISLQSHAACGQPPQHSVSVVPVSTFCPPLPTTSCNGMALKRSSSRNIAAETHDTANSRTAVPHAGKKPEEDTAQSRRRRPRGLTSTHAIRNNLSALWSPDDSMERILALRRIMSSDEMQRNNMIGSHSAGATSSVMTHRTRDRPRHHDGMENRADSQDALALSKVKTALYPDMDSYSSEE
jgi:hypothetical protein